MKADRTLPWDWYPGRIPENVFVADTAYVETTFSFLFFRSQLSRGMEIGHGASTYLGTMFDVGPRGCVKFGDYALLSWNVVLMDTYRLPLNILARRQELERIPTREPRVAAADVPARPIHLQRNVWIGFDVCVLPGVTIGEGSVVGARSVVTENVPPYSVVAGNPARVIRRLGAAEPQSG